ncbi:hypothetical protein [Corynebacterium sp. HMSC04H06]|uniref:hypothetical protein n=1 Tax=Corynebacterium sp. HMSC04H06 TaxID=1581050 RepID=UPI0009F56CB0|nr:hypothetical protein [Corynebacterium sp. HMSC04H06]
MPSDQPEQPASGVADEPFSSAAALKHLSIDRQQAYVVARVLELAAETKRPMKPVTVLIDGPSGAGKTWLSARLAERDNCQVVHLDEFYPGWHGLDRGSEMVYEHVLRQMNPGYWRWDWEANAPGEWMSLDARDDLIVEGVGSVTPESLATARQRGSVVAVWVTGPREERKERALSRDPYYAEWFEVWEDQEKEHFAELEAAGIEFDVHWDWTPAQD